MNCDHIDRNAASPVATIQVLSANTSPRKDRVCGRCARKYLEAQAKNTNRDIEIIVEMIPRFEQVSGNVRGLRANRRPRA